MLLRPKLRHETDTRGIKRPPCCHRLWFGASSLHAKSCGVVWACSPYSLLRLEVWEAADTLATLRHWHASPSYSRELYHRQKYEYNMTSNECVIAPSPSFSTIKQYFPRAGARREKQLGEKEENAPIAWQLRGKNWPKRVARPLLLAPTTETQLRQLETCALL